MKNPLLALALIATLAAAPMHQAQAGLMKKAFLVGSLVVGGVALSKTAATKHCAEHPGDAQCDKHVKGTDADPAVAAPAPTPAGATPSVGVAPAPKAAKDPNAMIDAGATKAKDLTSKAGSWIAKKKAEYEAKKLARANAATPGAAPGAIEAAPAPVPLK